MDQSDRIIDLTATSTNKMPAYNFFLDLSSSAPDFGHERVFGNGMLETLVINLAVD